MKKYIFIILLFLLAYEAYPQVSLSTRDSVTSFQPIDLFWLQRKVTGSFLNRKVSWSYLRSNMIDYIDGLANTWALGQTFSSRATFSKGATFSAASYGAVTFNDSLYMGQSSLLYSNNIRPSGGAYFTTVGSPTIPYDAMYSKGFIVMNPEENDSAKISYDDSTLTINKTVSIANLKITNQFQTPDSASTTGLALSQTPYSPSFVTDTIITLSSVASSLEIAPPGSMPTGIEKILMTGAGDGQILVITNRIAVTIVFEDNEADGNLLLNSDFSMGQWQPLVLMYNSKISKWIEVSRSSN